MCTNRSGLGSGFLGLERASLGQSRGHVPRVLQGSVRFWGILDRVGCTRKRRPWPCRSQLNFGLAHPKRWYHFLWRFKIKRFPLEPGYGSLGTGVDPVSPTFFVRHSTPHLPVCV